MRYLMVFVTLATALVSVTLDETDPPVLRGHKQPQTLLNTNTDDAVSADQRPENDDLQPVDRYSEIELKKKPVAGRSADEPRVLNLKLPDMDWEEPYVGQTEMFPNIFARKANEPLVHWSGRLHLDESEEAKARPLNETILGAELELELKLP